jgi:phosphoglycerate dehydrogenase-like enzyme
MGEIDMAITEIGPLSKKHEGSPPDPANGASPGRSLQQTEIGFIGLGHMGSAMAANLAAASYRVMAYVRRPDQMGALAALGLKSTTENIYSE